MKSPYPTNEVRHWFAPCMVVVCLLALALCWSPVTAQGFGDWTVYRAETTNGPSGLQVRSLWQDTDGGLWVGSSEGLSHFDGLHWRHLTKRDGLPDTTIRAVIRDRAGRLWIGTDHGAARLDGDRWTIYSVHDGLAGEEVNALLADQHGHLWFGTRDGLSRFDGLAWITYTFANGLSADTVLSLAEDQEGNVWAGTIGGVSRFDGRQWKTFDVDDGLAGNGVAAISSDRDGGLWFGTWRGASHYDGSRWVAYTVANSGLANDHISAIAQDATGAMWFGTDTGLSRFDGERWQTFRSGDGLADDTIFSLLSDHEGALWVGSLTGVSRFNGSTLQVYATAEHGTGDSVLSLLHDHQGQVWIGTNEGVARLKGGNWIAERGPGAPSDLTEAMVLDREGRVVAGFERGASRFDGQQWQAVPLPDSFAEVISLARDQRGDLWFGTLGKGVYRWATDGAWTSFTKGEGLSSDVVRAIWVDEQGSQWFGTAEGVSRFKDGEWQSWGRKDGVAGVLSIGQAAGALWFGTFGGGVVRFDEHVWSPLTATIGLEGGIVSAILRDTRDHLWFATDQGATHFDPVRQAWRTIKAIDGLPSDAVNAVSQDREGNIWIGTSNGVVRYQPSRWPPRVGLARVSVVGDPERQSLTGTLSLPFDRNNLSIALIAGDLRTPIERLQYRARWQPSFPGDPCQPWCSGSRIEARLPAGGTYALWVIALDDDLNASEETAAATITIAETPITRRPEFLIAFTAFLVGTPTVAYSIYRARRKYALRYADFELTLVERDDHFTAQVTNAPALKMEQAISLPLATKLPQIQREVSKAESGEVTAKFLEYLGSTLFEAIVADQVATSWKANLRRSRVIRLRLRIESPRVAALPWELLYGGDRWGFLATSPRTALVRSVSTSQAPSPLRARLPIRLLVAIASPRGLEPLDVQREKQKLQEALQSLIEAKRLKLTVLEQATLERLQDQLLEGTDIVHFVGHGTYDHSKDESIICFEDESGGLDPVDEERFVGLFQGLEALGDRAPKLIVLNACQTAARGSGKVVAGMAAQLAQQGLPAVIGMQYPIWDIAAIIFSRTLYSALVRWGQVDFAVSEARKAVAAQLERGGLDWAAPVLYLQTPDGLIWQR